MNNCYRSCGCGPYENRSCYECPASKPIYKCKNCGHFAICQSFILTGDTLACPNYSVLYTYMQEKEKKENKKVKVTKMKKNIPSKVKEENEEINSCPACTLKEYKSRIKFAYSFAPDFFKVSQDEEELKVALCKDNKTNEWFIHVSYYDEDYDMREINREFSIPIKYCPICGKELN